jgi:HSP20 family protein
MVIAVMPTRQLANSTRRLAMAIWNDYLPSRKNQSADLSEIFDRLQREFFSPDSFPGSQGDFTPKIEVKETEKEYRICAEVPGMNKEDINLTLKDNRLIIEGERKHEEKKEEKDYIRSEFSYGSFYRSIPLGDDVNPDKVSASYNDGLLEVKVEKSGEDKKKSKKIQIKQ